PELGLWVVRQRALQRRGKLSADRIERLNALGFEWSGGRSLKSQLDREWDRRFEALSEFVRVHGHTRAPMNDSRRGRLGAWVFRQRYLRRVGKLSAERIRQLETLPFPWSPTKSGR